MKYRGRIKLLCCMDPCCSRIRIEIVNFCFTEYITNPLQRALTERRREEVRNKTYAFKKGIDRCFVLALWVKKKQFWPDWGFTGNAAKMCWEIKFCLIKVDYDVLQLT